MTKSQIAPPSKETHFLVTGGGKGITGVNTTALARSVQCRFTLLGRSEVLTNEPNWASGIDDEKELKTAALEHYRDAGRKITPREVDKELKRILSSREIQQTLSRIKKAGGVGEYVQVDITNPADVKNKLSGKIKGVSGLIHGAGALADKYIQDKSEADFDLVYGVKVGGLKNLFQLIPPGQLKYLVLFSSVAGFYGNAGQADYSISNEILNKLAHHIQLIQPECQVLSIGWGPWDGGMVTPQLKRIFERAKIPLISPEDGANALISLLSDAGTIPQHVVGNPLPAPPGKMDQSLKKYRISRELGLRQNPFLADHVIGGNAVLPTVFAVAWFINKCESIYPGYQFFAARDYRVFKGIVFEDSNPTEYWMDLEELSKDSKQIIFTGKISSMDEDGKQRFHYQAEIEIRKTIPERPKLEEFDLSEVESIHCEELYGAKILFHGPGFQGVERLLNISPEGLTTKCQTNVYTREEMGQFPVRGFDPVLADVHLQSLLIWANNQKGTTGLPLHIGSGTQYQKAVPGEITYATMRVKNITAHKLVADVISHDKDGYIYTEVKDAEITLNDRLTELFQDNQLEVEQVWT
jgi:NAD(P)-dependent dehydrogenase (short-subunit alcohol dehydrogenase family)